MKHALANYPKKFLRTVISPLKICLQFADVQVKFRRNLDSPEWLKMPNGDIAVPIATTGTDVETSNMGCPIPVLETMQLELLDTYLVYCKYNNHHYKAAYNRDFLDFLETVQDRLSETIEQIKEFRENEDEQR